MNQGLSLRKLEKTRARINPSKFSKKIIENKFQFLLIYFKENIFLGTILYHMQLNQQIDPKMIESFQLLYPGKKKNSNHRFKLLSY